MIVPYKVAVKLMSHGKCSHICKISLYTPFSALDFWLFFGLWHPFEQKVYFQLLCLLLMPFVLQNMTPKLKCLMKSKVQVAQLFFFSKQQFKIPQYKLARMMKRSNKYSHLLNWNQLILCLFWCADYHISCKKSSKCGQARVFVCD